MLIMHIFKQHPNNSSNVVLILKSPQKEVNIEGVERESTKLCIINRKNIIQYEKT